MRIRHIAALIILTALFMIPAPSVSADCKVLVIINESSPASVEIGNYYAKKRQIPSDHICKIKCQTTEAVYSDDYNKIRSQVRDYLTKTNLKDKIDYIVTTKGVPLKSMKYSVDSMLTVLWSDVSDEKLNNPYCSAKGHFSHAQYGIYLVTRLDGYTVEDAKKLVDNSLAAEPRTGVFLFNLDPMREKLPGYKDLNDLQRRAMDLLTQNGITCQDDDLKSPTYKAKLMGYYTWGSNGREFSQERYASWRFYPGAIAETIVSTSARTFEHTTGGQSLIADIIHSGITGVKGYAYEPHADAMAQPQVLFGRYLMGMNLAESFYSASPYLHWMDVVIGDPLCAPFAPKAAKK